MNKLYAFTLSTFKVLLYLSQMEALSRGIQQSLFFSRDSNEREEARYNCLLGSRINDAYAGQKTFSQPKCFVAF